MLEFDDLDVLSGPIIELYEQYTQSVLNEIARRLKTQILSGKTAWMMQRLTESGLIYEYALKELEKLTGYGDRELRRAFQKAGVRATQFDDSVYAAAGLKPLPLNLSPAMGQVLAAGLRKTEGVMHNLTLSTALSAQNAFVDAVDLAYMQVSSGAFDYISAIQNAIRDTAANGLPVIQYARRKDQLDVAVRRAVLTGVSQTTGELQLARARELGVNQMQVSAHIGARNKGTGPANHELWQGKVYSIDGGTAKYPNLVDATGYGTVTGLYGINCRHSMYPFFEGISEELYSKKTLDSYSEKTVRYKDKEMSVYEATQAQRGIERKIREWKREAGILDAAGLDSGDAMAKVREWQGKMREFVKETGLIRQRERERVIYITKPIAEPGFFEWEMQALRRTAPTSISLLDVEPYKNILVPKSVNEKILTKHPNDIEFLARFGELISSWAYAGSSPKSLGKIEFYKQLDEIWFTAVVKKDPNLQAYVLTTFHRIYSRKLQGRIEKGYLLKGK